MSDNFIWSVDSPGNTACLFENASQVAGSSVTLKLRAVGNDADIVWDGTTLTIPGGGGGSAVKQASVSITNAEVLAAFAGSGLVELVAAPGAGKAFVFVGALLVVDTSAGAYSGIDSTDSEVAIRSGATVSISNVIDNTSVQGIFENAAVVGVRFSPVSPAVGSAPLADMEDQPIDLELYSGTSVGGGNVANSIAGTIYYIEVTLP